MSESEIVEQKQCPRCAKEGRDTACDNLYVFKSGVEYCNACDKTISVNKDIKQKINKDDKEMLSHLGTNLLDGFYSALPKRKISKKTCMFYGYMLNTDNEIKLGSNRYRGLQIANYYDDAGNIVMQQIRTKDKQFPIFGNKDHKNDLWGLHKFNPDPNVFVTITEGQIDAMSIAEVFQCRWPVVSLPKGAGTAAQAIQANMHKLSQFKYVVLAFDNDKKGKEALEDCLKLFEPGKLRIAQLTRKDANEMLVEGLNDELINCIYRAVEYIPAPILTGKALLQHLKGRICETYPWPWKNAQRIIRPIKIPGLYTIAAKPKVGKTEFVGEIIRSVIGNGENIGIVALESTIKQLIIKVTSGLTGKDLTEITDRELSQQEIDLCAKFLDQMVIYDHITYGSDLESVVHNLPYMVKTLGCKFVIYDNISYSATSAGDSERIGIDKAMKAFKDSTVKYEYALFNVCHLKRNDIQLSDDDIPDITQIRGSQGIEMYSDYVIGLSRKTSSENEIEKNTLVAHVLADRHTGQDTGKFFKMRYNPKTRFLGDL